MNQVQYSWIPISYHNFRKPMIRALKYAHQVHRASILRRSLPNPFHLTHIRERKGLSNIKYVQKITLNANIPLDIVLRDNFPHAKNSIQTISLNTFLTPPSKEFHVEDNIDLEKILCCAKNLNTIRWGYGTLDFNIKSLEQWTSCAPRNGLKGIGVPILKLLQIQFEFSCLSKIQDYQTKFLNFPMIKLVMNYQGNPWELMTVDLFIHASVVKKFQIGHFLNKLEEMKGFSMHIVGQKSEIEHVKEFFSLCNRLRNLKRLEMKADVEKFSPEDLSELEFPEKLEVLKFRIGAENMLEDEKTMESFLKFGIKINSLKSLKTLDLRLPTTFYVNQMMIFLKEGMANIEEISLEFIEDKKHKVHEEFYVNSYMEWLVTMPKLKKIKLKATKLNFTNCSFLIKEQERFFENLESIEWIDDSLERMNTWRKDYKTKISIECEKTEDLGGLLSLINEEKTENIEIPLVFDGLTGDYGLKRLREKLCRMRNLKRLRFYVGFELLEKENVRLVEEFLGDLKVKRVDCFVYYREVKEEAIEEIFKMKERKKLYRFSVVSCPPP